MPEIPIDSRQVLRDLAAAAADRAVRAAPIPRYRSATCASILAEDSGEVAVLLDGESALKFGQVVGGFYPTIGDRVWCLEQPPHGLVVAAPIGLYGLNGPTEVIETLGGASPTEALTSAGLTNWPIAGNTTVAVPVWATRCVVQHQITGTTPTSTYTLDYETRLGGAAGVLRRQIYAGNNHGYPIVGLDEFTVSPNSVLSAQIYAQRIAGAGAMNYGANGDVTWSFRFHEV